MANRNRQFSLGAIIIGFFLSSDVIGADNISWGEFVADFSIRKAEKVYYEYNSDGVPVLGLVTNRTNKNLWKFTMCNNTTLDVDPKQLHKSEATCPRQRRSIGPWTAKSKTISPLIIKTGTDSTNPIVEFDGKKINIQSMPIDYKKTIARAKDGDLFGVAFTGEDGKKSIVILTDEQP